MQREIRCSLVHLYYEPVIIAVMLNRGLFSPNQFGAVKYQLTGSAISPERKK